MYYLNVKDNTIMHQKQKDTTKLYGKYVNSSYQPNNHDTTHL